MRPLHTSHGRGLARVSAGVQQRRPAMSPLFMVTGCELNSPGSVSAEGSNTAGSEREEEGEHTGRRGRIKQEKNKNAARKSRRKQTKRADELHEELQCLERSNSAIKKEIAALKKDFDSYTAALERHEPSCCLKGSAAASSSSAGPSGDPPEASRSAFPAAPSLSTSLTPSLDLQPRDCVQSARFSPVTPPAATTSALPRGSSAGLFASSSSVTAPDSVSFSVAPTLRTLFSTDSPSLIELWPTHVPPVCTGLVSHPAVSRSVNPSVLDDFLMTQASFPAPSSNAVPFNSQSAAENAGQDCPVSLTRSLPDPSPKSLSMSGPAPVFASKPSYSEQFALSHSSLISMLSFPSPPKESQTTSSSFDQPVLQPPPSLGDPSRDRSLCELLDCNEWILSGTNYL